MILFVSFQNHLLINLVAVVVSALGARELSELFARKETGYQASVVVIPLLGALLPAVQLAILNGLASDAALQIAIYVAISLVLVAQVFRKKEEEFGHTLSNTAANVTVLLYPGFFLTYFIRISEFEHATGLIMLFLAIAFANDTLAYVAGSLFKLVKVYEKGARWRPRVSLPVSPNKTLVGFLFGWLGSVGAAAIASAFFARYIPLEFWPTVLIGATVGVAVILGDLIESALKRSATSKDSGDLIPGRGGILDSIDSVLYAAPVFYYLLSYLL